jgi:hypothetical protein
MTTKRQATARAGRGRDYIPAGNADPCGMTTKEQATTKAIKAIATE